MAKPNDQPEGEPQKSGPEPKTSRARSTTRTPATGKGWGGPAKGKSTAQRKPLTGTPGPGRGKFSVAGEARKEANYRRVETLLQFLWDVSQDAKERMNDRLNAANSLLNRVQGLPVQTVVTASTDDLSMMDDHELVADVERRSGKIRAFREAIMGADVPQEPDRVDDRST